MSVELLITLIVGIAAPVASVIGAVITSKQTQKKLMKQQLDAQQSMIEQTNEIMMLTLRTTIQGVYAMYKNDRYIPAVIWAGCCEMFDLYKLKNGNCYIDTIMKEMKGWDKI